jgi:uncharacterized protein
MAPRRVTGQAPGVAPKAPARAARTMEDLRRLDRLCGLLVARANVSRTRLLLFGRSGFAPDLLDAAQTRSDVELIDLERLYEGD